MSFCKATDRSISRPLWQTALLACAVLLVGATATTALAQPIEVCDGIDNDNDGLIDEGFDFDGDGVARCCRNDPFFATTSYSQDQIQVFYKFCTGNFTPGITPAVGPPGQVLVQLHAVGQFDQDPGLDIIWRDRNIGQRYMTTCAGEWVTRKLGRSRLNFFGGGDMELDGDEDLVSLDAGLMTGITALNNSSIWAQFTDPTGTYTPTPFLQAAWVRARAYNLEDITGDGLPDLLVWGYSTGGGSTTIIYPYENSGGGTFAQMGWSVAVPSQPQNFGDMGDINNDGLTDWVGGPDDDSDRGGVFGGHGTYSGGTFTFSSPVLLVDNCSPNSNCTGGSVPGKGISQLYDWDCDGDLDLLASRGAGSTGADVLFWENLSNGVFSNQYVVVVASGGSSAFGVRFASPLRH